MKTVLIIIGVVLLLVLSCVLSWKTAKVHELHKVRAAFYNYESILKKNFGSSSDRFLEGVEECEKIVEEIEEEEKHTVI